ncbi:MAG: hypothetical protein JW704_01625 [Anaerolineaceae bacterium]|nr:hypothetical protein [Anaerolineaceae bacterium]MBN2677434.1 hypothetical protein [Anaerolineaceae bacterium]
MISLYVIFWIFFIIFAFIGLLRGWARELLVTLSAIGALFLLTLIELYIPAITSPMNATSLFWFRTCVLLALAAVGYLSPKLPVLAINVRLSYESLQNSILGMLMGGFNAYLITGSIWHFLEKAKYPFADVLSAPDGGSVIGEKTLWLISHLPPTWLEIPTIYIAVVILLIIVILALRS